MCYKNTFTYGTMFAIYIRVIYKKLNPVRRSHI